MPDKDSFQHVFDALKPILEAYAPDLSVTEDEAGLFYLDTKHIMDNKKPLFLARSKSEKAM